MALKQFVKAITPPVLFSAAAMLKQSSRNTRPPYEFVPEGWQSNLPFSGWDAASVCEAYKAEWPDFLVSVGGTQPQHLGYGYGLLAGHNIVACFNYSIALAARNKDTLSMLDWGGGIGFYYIRSKAALPKLTIEYYCKDVPSLAEAGQKLNPDAHFSSDESCFNRTYDFVLASTSLHYSQDWNRVLTSLAKSTEGYLLLNRLPCHRDGASYVYRQQAHGSTFLSWSFNRAELLKCADAAGLKLLREFLISDSPQPIHNAPSPSVMSAYLFQKHDDPH